MERLVRTALQPTGEPLIAIDGPPGVGKTTHIIERTSKWTERGAVVTFTNSAADILRARATGLGTFEAGTIYSLSWPAVKRTVRVTQGRGHKSTSPWHVRTIKSTWDTALDEYTDAAPSKQGRSHYTAAAETLHAWDGKGQPPFALADFKPIGPLKFILPLARWIAAGSPILPEESYGNLLIDEAQDMSALELRATLGLLAEGASATAYLDPGQAIFAGSKGIGDALPPAWVWAREQWRLNGGFRIGQPATDLATRVLSPYYSRPAKSFTKPGRTTNVLEWTGDKPKVGLVLGYSRASVANQFKDWDLANAAVIPSITDADAEIVMSTIHSAKGAEANDVYLLPWSRQALERLEKRSPDELRLLYVALTRARYNLHVPWQILSRIKYL
jgi:superfamily I DNA/RNA helicase